MRQDGAVLECVVNISEGREPHVLAELASVCGSDLLDVHSDAHHHRSVFTLVGDQAIRTVAERAVQLLAIDVHEGVHPRLGVVDVVPFVAWSEPTSRADARRTRDEFATWAANALGVPCFLYGELDDGTERTLPDIRRNAWRTLAPDVGPPEPHPTAGAMCVGERPPLIAYNVWLPESAGLDEARRVAAAVRRPGIRTLGLMVGDRPQVSMNLVELALATPADAYDAVSALTQVEGAELVGLVPESVLESIDPGRWDQLDIGPDRTVESRLASGA